MKTTQAAAKMRAVGKNPRSSKGSNKNVTTGARRQENPKGKLNSLMKRAQKGPGVDGR